MNSRSLVSDLVSSIKHHGLELLNQINTPQDFVGIALQRFQFDDPYTMRALAYSHAYMGEYNQAIQELSALVDSLQGGYQWMTDMADQASKFRDCIKRDPDEAQKLLLSWEAQTIDNPGLREFVSEVEPK